MIITQQDVHCVQTNINNSDIHKEFNCITVMGNYQFHLPEAISNYGRIRVFIFRGDLFTERGGSRLDKALLSVHKDHLHITEYCPKLQWKQGGR